MENQNKESALLGNKERLKIKRHDMPARNPEERVKDFKEVAIGYSIENAIEEAKRCIDCKVPYCIQGCPVSIDIPAFIKLIEKGDFLGAARKIREKSSLPAICGRVCPQEDQCEKVCTIGKRKDSTSVAIGYLERFVADYEAEHGKKINSKNKNLYDKKIAIVGAGPSGLATAGELRQKGYQVSIFEALHEVGGVLIYGVPEFRLPKSILLREVQILQDMGVEIFTNVVIGKTITVDELLNEKGFSAVFIGTGAGTPKFLNIPGEELNGIYSANEFLTRINLMRAYNMNEYDTPMKCGKTLVVFGAGNTAMDAVRTGLRLGYSDARIFYRRSRNEMTARIDEIHHAEEEGIKFEFLINPVRFIGDEKQNIKQVECQRMELGEPDESGRRRPIPIKGSEFVTDIDAAVIAIGTNVNPIVPSSTPGMNLNKWGYIIADEKTGKTTKKGVFAGGDIVTGAATVILAMGAGKIAAESIDEYLKTSIW
ncbi:MAG: NADPH-dependent glutamate synthase [Candidatus Acididesulfobacter diazotrophicus]|jgi:glutamate synthase (NADPH/NADH) small chain|uniref:NADPH-dependent glutamate synthase n=1 Tax=Candidatus Acididesulfobacter diazotrophicus TaxID=2597226 RepID=A0A519BM63_9DELT|nr:MAG: NADPH-dependent glutamate synthase [Candidatus Acididesulfobacter diazotrophicus]